MIRTVVFVAGLVAFSAQAIEGGTTEERLCVALLRHSAVAPNTLEVTRLYTDPGNPPKSTTLLFNSQNALGARLQSRASCFYEPGYYENGGALRASFPFPFHRFCTTEVCIEGLALRRAFQELVAEKSGAPLRPETGPKR